MNDILAIPERSVADVLNSAPKTAKLFVQHGTACIGCYLARLCTIKEVAASYEIELDPFLKEISEIIQSSQRSNTNESV